MALTKKQIRQLRALAHHLNPQLSVGRNDITDTVVKQASQSLDSHELVKCSVQDGSSLGAKEAAELLAGQIGADVVQVIGNRFTLYRRSKRDDVEHIALVRE